MTRGRSIRRWGVALGIVAVAASAGIGGTALAGKPPPPPPTSTQKVYYQVGPADGIWHSMDMSGGNKTSLPSTAGVGMSRALHGGAYLSVFLEANAGNGTIPGSNEALPDLAVQPVNSASSTVVVQARGATWNLQFTPQTTASFLPGDDTALTFTALEWTGDMTAVAHAGFYKVTLTYDGSGAVTEASAPALLFTIPHQVRNNGQLHEICCRTRFDWLDASTVVWARQGTEEALRIFKTTVPATPADYLACSTMVGDDADSSGPVAVNPSRTRIAFSTSAGLIEMDANGGNRYLWVPWVLTNGSRNAKMYSPNSPCYADDDTVVYRYETFNYNTYTSTWDIYVITRGGSATNLSGDVSTWLTPWAVR